MPSYEQRNNSKLWTVRFRAIQNGEEKQIRLSGFKTKREAQQAYAEYITTKPIKKDANEPLYFNEVVDQYIQYASTRIKPGTLYDLELKFQKHVYPFFEDKAIKDVTPLDILTWQQGLEEYSYNYKNGLRSMITSVYKYADRYLDIPNIMHKVEPFRNVKAVPEMLYWTKDEFNAFYQACDNKMYQVYFYLLYVTGCRKGEALALSWEDIDLEAGTIRIYKNITKKVKNVGWAITTTKNKNSNRTVDIGTKTIGILKDYQAWQKENFENTAFVFGGERPIPMTNMGRYFENTCKAAGVKRIRIHDLRHSCASLLISNGISIVAVSNRLGHKNIEQTLNTYSHMMPEDNTKMLKVLDSI